MKVNGKEIECKNGLLKINGKMVCGLLKIHDAENEQVPPEHIKRAAGRAVLLWCNSPMMSICTEEVAIYIRGEIAKERKLHEARDAAEQKRKLEIEEAEKLAIEACPEGKEAARIESTFDGNTFVVAVKDGAKSVVYGEPESTYGICYLDPSVFDMARGEAAKKAKKTVDEKTAYDAKMAEAKDSGKPVVIRSWVTNRCHNGNDDQCSFDSAVEYAMPDGTTKITYTCCH